MQAHASTARCHPANLSKRITPPRGQTAAVPRPRRGPAHAVVAPHLALVPDERQRRAVRPHDHGPHAAVRRQVHCLLDRQGLGVHHHHLRVGRQAGQWWTAQLRVQRAARPPAAASRAVRPRSQRTAGEGQRSSGSGRDSGGVDPDLARLAGGHVELAAALVQQHAVHHGGARAGGRRDLRLACAATKDGPAHVHTLRARSSVGLAHQQRPGARTQGRLLSPRDAPRNVPLASNLATRLLQ